MILTVGLEMAVLTLANGRKGRDDGKDGPRFGARGRAPEVGEEGLELGLEKDEVGDKGEDGEEDWDSGERANAGLRGESLVIGATVKDIFFE